MPLLLGATLLALLIDLRLLRGSLLLPFEPALLFLRHRLLLLCRSLLCGLLLRRRLLLSLQAVLLFRRHGLLRRLLIVRHCSRRLNACRLLLAFALQLT